MANNKHITWELQNGYMKTLCTRDVMPEAHRLVMTLSNGGRVSVELWERAPGEVSIRVHDGTMLIEPEASNTITIRNRTYLEQAEQAAQAAHPRTKKRARRP